MFRGWRRAVRQSVRLIELDAANPLRVEQYGLGVRRRRHVEIQWRDRSGHRGDFRLGARGLHLAGIGALGSRLALDAAVTVRAHVASMNAGCGLVGRGPFRGARLGLVPRRRAREDRE